MKLIKESIELNEFEEDESNIYKIKVIGDWKPARREVYNTINAISDDGLYMTFEASNLEEAKEIVDELNEANIGGIKGITLIENDSFEPVQIKDENGKVIVDLTGEDGFVGTDLEEDYETSPYYNITYKVADGIFSTLVVKASSEEEAKEIFDNKKPEYADVVIGNRKISTEEAEGLLKRGMSLLEKSSLKEDFKSKEDALAYLKKKSEEDPEAAALIQAFLQLMKEPKIESLNEDTQIDKIEVEVKVPEEEESKEEEEEKSVEGAEDFTPEELAKEAKEIAKTPNPPEAGIDTVVANELNRLIVGELNTMTDYNNFIELLVANNTNTEIINVIKDVNSEEAEHVGQLQQALKMIAPNAINFEAGKLEAAKQIAVPVNVGDPSVDGKETTEMDINKDTLLDPEQAKIDRSEINKK